MSMFNPNPTKPEPNIRCTYCGGTLFFEGPSGGMSTNVLCGNLYCRHWFNHTPFGLEDLCRVEPTKGERDAERAATQADGQARIDARRAEGAAAYREGRSLESLRTTGSGFGEAKSNIDRISGFIDELAKDVRKSILP